MRQRRRVQWPAEGEFAAAGRALTGAQFVFVIGHDEIVKGILNSIVGNPGLPQIKVNKA